ncbi:hypothetical protein ACFPM0_24640 [Pseudonocardia sulfidoxydans]
MPQPGSPATPAPALCRTRRGRRVTFRCPPAMEGRARREGAPSGSGRCRMARMSAAVIVLEMLAMSLAVAVFGPFVLLVGVPALLATVLVLATVVIAERRRVRREAEAAVLPTVPGGLMSGFFRVPAQTAPVDAPERSRS